MHQKILHSELKAPKSDGVVVSYEQQGLEGWKVEGLLEKALID